MTKVILTAEQASSNCKKESELEIKTSKYLEFLTVRKMIYKFLTRDRIVLVPTKIPKLTELELANKLNITSAQLRRLQKSQASYKQTISKINLPLIKLYCSTKWI
ncbi:MAG: hypothetical protein WCH10_06895 [bacterium]